MHARGDAQLGAERSPGCEPRTFSDHRQVRVVTSPGEGAQQAFAAFLVVEPRDRHHQRSASKAQLVTDPPAVGAFEASDVHPVLHHGDARRGNAMQLTYGLGDERRHRHPFVAQPVEE